MRPGEVVHKEDIITARPATGLHPHRLESLIGKRVMGHLIMANTPVLENHVA